MQTQNFEHHTSHDKFLYTLTVCAIILGILLCIVLRKVNSVVALNGLQYIMPIFVPVFLIALMMKMRKYATVLQDRVIRQELQFRYFVATGKTLPESITLQQMIGLRFAGDSEFISLTDHIVANPTITSKEIKSKINNWKGDFNRV